MIKSYYVIRNDKWIKSTTISFIQKVLFQEEEKVRKGECRLYVVG